MNPMSKSIVLCLIATLVLAGCTLAGTPAPAGPANSASSAWNDTVGAAQREGKVVVITRLAPEVRTALGQAFKEKYGVDVEYILGTVPEMQPKVVAERSAGQYLQDVVHAGSSSLRELKKINVLAPMERELILPEVANPQAWRGGQLPFQDQEHLIALFLSRVGPTIAINSDLVKPQEIKSYNDLLDPKWKGKIAMFDPTVSGPGNAVVTGIFEAMGSDYLGKLVKMEPVITRDARQQLEWVAKAKYPLALGFDFTVMEEIREAGAPIVHVVPAEGTYIGAATGSIALFDKPAHPNAARLFVNWLLSKEAQTLFVKVSREQSRRADVPSELAADRQINPSIKYSDFDSDAFQNDANQIRDRIWKELMAGASK